MGVDRFAEPMAPPARVGAKRGRKAKIQSIVETESALDLKAPEKKKRGRKANDKYLEDAFETLILFNLRKVLQMKVFL